MSLAVKIWQTGSPEPVDATHDFPDSKQVPRHWFKEDPKYAAELYGLELGIEPGESKRCISVSVLDTGGVMHLFDVDVFRTIEVRVRKSGGGGRS
jgi:hypothetical protein